jgi:hypothetical protein
MVNLRIVWWGTFGIVYNFFPKLKNYVSHCGVTTLQAAVATFNPPFPYQMISSGDMAILFWDTNSRLQKK